MSLVALADVTAVTIDPTALSSSADALRTHATAATERGHDVASSWNTLPASYDAPEAADLFSRMTVVEEAAVDLGTALGRVAEVMTTLADQLALARAREQSLRSEIESFRRAVEGFRASDDLGQQSTEETWGPGQYIRNAELLGDCAALRTLVDTAIDEARGDLASIGRPGFAVTGLDTDATPTAAPTGWTTQQQTLTTTLALTILGTLGSGDADRARALLAAHPDWLRLFAQNAPDAASVNAWWMNLAGSNPGAVDALTIGASLIVGSLGGVPPASRVAANAFNARAMIPDIQAQIRQLEQAGRGGEVAVNAAERREAIARLKKQLDYLQRAADGEVQLYLYEPGSQSIIEMIGTLDENTTDVITYVPGTFTSVHSFYNDEVQQVGRWLNANDPRMVAFVWKEGTFPGENSETGSMNLLRILEANDEKTALDAGGRIARFQNALYASSHEAAVAEHDGMGHSWGLAGVTSSELAGAHYDQVHSLAGAGMPSDWERDRDTSYFHWGYTDALSIAQDTGAVWDGKIPVNEPAFTSHVYGREGDFQLYLPGPTTPGGGVISPQPPPSIPVTTDPIGNHNLIASDQADNQKALRDIRRELEK